MKRIDIALILGLLLLLGAQWALSRPSTGSSWQQREKEVQGWIEGLFSRDMREVQREILSRPEIRWRFEVASWGATAVAVGSLAAFTRLLFCLFTGRPLYRPVGTPAPPGWGLRQILRLTAAVLLAVNAAALGEWALIHFFRPGWLDRPVIAMANTLLADGVILAAAAVLFRRVSRSSLPRPRRWAGVGFALGSYLTFLPFLLALMVGLAAVLRVMEVPPSPQPVFTVFLSEGRSSVLVWLLFLVTVIGPLAEEVFFRGLLYGWLRTRLGILRALLLSSLVFALLHTDPVVFVPIFALGLLFGWVYERTGTLAAPAAIHILHNGAMLYAAFLVKTLLDL